MAGLESMPSSLHVPFSLREAGLIGGAMASCSVASDKAGGAGAAWGTPGVWRPVVWSPKYEEDTHTHTP